MSQMTAAARVSSPRPTRARGVSAPTRPTLRVVHAAPATRGNLWFVLVLGSLIIGGLLAMLLLNTARAEGSFILSDLRTDQAALHAEQVTLQTELAEVSSPAALAENAQRLGMTASPSTATLRLSDGSVSGVAAMVRDGKTLTVEISPRVATVDASAGD